MLAIVPARMSSRRLPGKALLNLADRPLLAWTVSRLQAAHTIDGVTVATSTDAGDDPIADFCARAGISVHRGPLDDVATRCAQAAVAAHAPAFVRISGDSPFIDPAIVDRAVSLYQNDDCDIVSNVLIRTFPKGQSVEVLRTTTFLNACQAMVDDRDREHVTRVYYEMPARYRMISFTSGSEDGQVQLAVDTGYDVEWATRLIAQTSGRLPGWRELVRIKATLEV
jgi:spore coat polysaccharide biosynthesis protein SpsF